VADFRVVGVDPGLAATGFAVVEARDRKGVAQVWDTISTSQSDPLPQRLRHIFIDFMEILKQWNARILVIEDAYVMQRFPKAALQLGAVRGVLKLAAALEEMDVIELTPTEVKVALTGNGRAPKEQVEKTVRKLCTIQGEIKTTHASDALALAIVGLSRCGAVRW